MGAYYLRDDVQYFPHGPEFKVPRGSDNKSIADVPTGKPAADHFSETAENINNSPIILVQNSSSETRRTGAAQSKPEKLVRVTLLAKTSDHFLTQSRYQTSYTGKIEKSLNGRILLKATKRSERSSSTLLYLVQNNGVGQATELNEAIWIDRNEIESIEVVD